MFNVTPYDVAQAKRLFEAGRDQVIQDGVDEVIDLLQRNYDADNPVVRAYLLGQVIDKAASRLSKSVLDYPESYGQFVGSLLLDQRALLSELLGLANDAAEDGADARLYDERRAELEADDAPELGDAFFREAALNEGADAIDIGDEDYNRVMVGLDDAKAMIEGGPRSRE